MVRLEALFFAALFLPGCIIVTDDADDDGAGGETGSNEGGEGPLGCGDPGSFSMFDEAGNCACEDGLVWCTDNEEDFSCCLPACGDPGTNSQVAEDGLCECMAGFEWCTTDEDDVNCCEA